jgi:prephenate dehydrogenase
MSNLAILGYGRFGRALGRLLLDANIPYRAFDSNADIAPEHRAASPKDLVSGATFVILAMPVRRMYEALTDLRPHLNRNQVVFDVGSVKVLPEAALSAALGDEIPWCGTHPLFGPVSLALAERPLRVVICPAKAHPEAGASVRSLYERIGCEVIEQTPESHDRVMAHTHALTFFVAKGMIDAGAGVDVQFAPPSFQAFARTIETVRSDGGHLFAAIARDNPFAAEARKELVQALAAIDRTLDAQSSGDEVAAAATRIAIPDLGERSPELRQAREHINEIDHAIVKLLAQRAQLQQRAAQAKAILGAPILDGVREAEILAERREWADQMRLDADGTVDVFRAILTMSRRAQRT